MLSLDDKRWASLKGGYRVVFDPRPLFGALKSKESTANAWEELWQNLHHQGDVGEASYAAIPHLVEIYRNSSKVDWNIYGIAAIIDLARTQGKNPKVPDFLQVAYFHSLQQLAQIGAKQIQQANDPDTVRAILSVIALSRGARIHARFLINYSEDELLEIEKRASEYSS